MALLQAGLRESRKARSRSPYPRSLFRDSHEGRYASLSDQPSLTEGPGQNKLSAPSTQSSNSDFRGSESHSGMSSRSGSLSVSEVIRGRLRAASASNPRGPFSNDLTLEDELDFLESRTRELEHTNQQLEVDKRVLEAKNSTLQVAYSELLNRVNAPRVKDADENMAIELNRIDFPLVKFWVKKSFMQGEAVTLPPGERGKGRASQGVNVAMRYAEDENGEPVDGYQAQYIRTWARGIWVEIAERGILRAKWGDMSVEDLKYYHQEMRRKFPIFTLCENSWKADQIAIDNYSSWHTSYAPKHATVKLEQESNVPVADGIPTKSEASLEFNVEPPNEKPKMTFKIANTLNPPSLSISPSATQPSVNPLAVVEPVVIPTETPPNAPMISEMTAIHQLPDDSSTMLLVNVDAAAVEIGLPTSAAVPASITVTGVSPSLSLLAPTLADQAAIGNSHEHLSPAVQPTSPSEIDLAASAAVPSASITRGTGVSLPSLSLLAPALADQAAIGDGHEHPAVQPGTSFNDSMTGVLTNVTNSCATSSQFQTASNFNESGKRILMRPSKVINGRNECAREWRGRIKGTTLEFNNYYTNLSAEVKQHWEKFAADLKAQLGKNAR